MPHGLLKIILPTYLQTYSVTCVSDEKYAYYLYLCMIGRKNQNFRQCETIPILQKEALKRSKSIVSLNILTPPLLKLQKRFLGILRFDFVVFVGSHFELVQLNTKGKLHHTGCLVKLGFRHI